VKQKLGKITLSQDKSIDVLTKSIENKSSYNKSSSLLPEVKNGNATFREDHNKSAHLTSYRFMNKNRESKDL
jgi:hypothetical protein